MVNIEELKVNLAHLPELLSREKVGELLGGDKPLKSETLANWHSTGRFRKELPVVKVGRYARYRKSDVIEFIVARTQTGGLIDG